MLERPGRGRPPGFGEASVTCSGFAHASARGIVIIAAWLRRLLLGAHSPAACVDVVGTRDGKCLPQIGRQHVAKPLQRVWRGAFETDFGSKPAKRRAASKVRRKAKAVSSSSSGSLASRELRAGALLSGRLAQIIHLARDRVPLAGCLRPARCDMLATPAAGAGPAPLLEKVVRRLAIPAWVAIPLGFF